LELCLSVDEKFKELDQEKLEELTFYAVEIRYPDAFYQPSIEEAREALKQAINLKKIYFKEIKRNKGINYPGKSQKKELKPKKKKNLLDSS